jgi:DNA polymerase-1
MKLAMLRVHTAMDREDLRGRVVMQVHDELLVEAPDAEVERTCELLKREMEAVYELDVPLLVDVGSGENWMEAK